MAKALIVKGDAEIQGDLTVSGAKPSYPRASLIQEAAVVYQVPWGFFRVHDNLAALLPTTAAADDLALIANFGTDSPTIQTSDAKATTVTQRAAFQYPLPAEYDAGETVTLRIRAAMNTTISDGTATVDVECYESDDEGGIGSDLCTTAATTINSLTWANVDFTITPTTLTAGDLLDVRITVAITDTATGTAVIGELGKVAFLLDVKG